jgi:hypothetical protein
VRNWTGRRMPHGPHRGELRAEAARVGARLARVSAVARGSQPGCSAAGCSGEWAPERVRACARDGLRAGPRRVGTRAGPRHRVGLAACGPGPTRPDIASAPLRAAADVGRWCAGSGRASGRTRVLRGCVRVQAGTSGAGWVDAAGWAAGVPYGRCCGGAGAWPTRPWRPVFPAPSGSTGGVRVVRARRPVRRSPGRSRWPTAGVRAVLGP